jgi:hypothetical protein
VYVLSLERGARMLEETRHLCALSLHALEQALPVVEDGGAWRDREVAVRHRFPRRPLHVRLPGKARRRQVACSPLF